MNVKELKNLLKDIPDEMQVLIPAQASEGFTGIFFSPCIEESGVGELGLEDFDEEEIVERELLGNPPETEKSFLLVPCSFFEEKDHSHELN